MTKAQNIDTFAPLRVATLNPGEPGAVATGCTCDPEANFHGEGEVIPHETDAKGRRRFYIRLYCPQHSEFTELGKS